MSAAEYYSHGSYPATRASLSSSAMRSELELIEAGFAKLPDLSGNGGKILAVNAGATALEAVTTTGTGNAVRATSPTLVTPVLGTPASGTLTNCTGFPVSALAGAAAGVLTFLATPSSANLRSALTDETGSGAAVFGTAPTISAAVLTGTTDLSGGQIKFPATQNASSDPNTLDDYEEGTFTPTVNFAGASVGTVYSINTGNYVKVGRIVFCEMFVTLSSMSSSVGQLRVTGLPFAATTENLANFPVTVRATGMTGITGAVQGYLANGSDIIYMEMSGTGSKTDIVDTNCTNSLSLLISVTYFV